MLRAAAERWMDEWILSGEAFLREWRFGLEREKGRMEEEDSNGERRRRRNRDLTST